MLPPGVMAARPPSVGERKLTQLLLFHVARTILDHSPASDTYAEGSTRYKPYIVYIALIIQTFRVLITFKLIYPIRQLIGLSFSSHIHHHHHLIHIQSLISYSSMCSLFIIVHGQGVNKWNTLSLDLSRYIMDKVDGLGICRSLSICKPFEETCKQVHRVWSGLPMRFCLGIEDWC